MATGDNNCASGLPRYRNGRFRETQRPAEQAPLFHETESSRAARVLAQAGVAKRRSERSAYVKAHCAALLATIPNKHKD